MLSRIYWDQVAIEQALLNDPEATYLTIFGEPKQRTGTTWRYEDGLIVTLKGRHAGHWYCFTENQGGGPIQALQRAGLDFKTALREGAALAGFKATPLPVQTKSSSRIKKAVITSAAQRQAHQVKRARMQAAASIWQGTQPLTGTLAEQYLREHRQILDCSTLQFRFWPVDAVWRDYDEQGQWHERMNKRPALVVAVRDAHGRLTGVQRIYLDLITAQKASNMANSKICKGVIAGSAGIVQLGSASGRLYVAEGPETAASIACADPKATVLAALSVSNLGKLGTVIQRYRPREVILAADNDGLRALTRALTEAAFSHLQSNLSKHIKTRLIYPDLVPGLSKTDWNNVLKQRGVLHLRNQLLRLK